MVFIVSVYPLRLGEDLSPLNLRNPFQTIVMTFLGSPDIFLRFVTKFLKVLGDGWAQIQPWIAQNNQFWILVGGSIRDRSEHCFVFLLHKQVVWRS